MLPLLARGTPEERRSFIPETSSRAPSIRKPARKQVSRACEHCRVRRVKCDTGWPCRSCKQKGLECNSRGKNNDEARTLPQALKEIERLRLRVEELEAEVEELHLNASAVSATQLTPLSNTSIPSTNSSSTLTPSSVEESSLGSPLSPQKVQWEGIYTATARSEQTSYYGPSSAFYFMSRIGSFLSQKLQQSFHDRSMQPKGINKTLVCPTSPGDSETCTERRAEPTKPSMSRIQEEYFLNLFWESHHANTPVINEGEFRTLYNSLWQNSAPYRKPSALVDIVLAISMQFGWTFLLQDTASNPSEKGHLDDSSIAGRWYYRRSQNLLATELESPSLNTLQCHILSVVYLCCASFQNMAHTTLAVCVRTAEILGLHLEPPETMPRSERELRKRLWWTVYTIEAKTCMKLGRPFTVQKSQITTSFPSDDAESASFFDSSLGVYDNEVTWLTYSVQTQKFIASTVDVYYLLYDKCAEILGQGGEKSLYKDPQGLELCAQFLSKQTPVLESWVHRVPSGLKLKRRGHGDSFAVDRCPVLFESSAPIWLQRNRICLELIYHTMLTNLYRPFINFSPVGTYTPTAERHAAACVNHAIAHTHIMHQVLKETDLMNGWQEFFLWQWNATVNTIGFVLGYPIHPVTSSARKSIEKAIEVFEVFGSNFAVAASAAKVTRDLTEKADLLINRLRSGITAGADAGTGVAEAGLDGEVWEYAGELGAVEGDGITEFMDWALTVDSFNSFEDLFADANNSMEWWTAN